VKLPEGIDPSENMHIMNTHGTSEIRKNNIILMGHQKLGEIT